MGWLNKIFKGSSHRISEGQYVGKYREEHVWDAPSTPPVILLYSLFFKELYCNSCQIVEPMAERDV